MKKLLSTLLFFSCLCISAENKFELPLWPDGVPESNGIKVAEKINKNNLITNVSVPTMTVFPADSAKNKGVALIICPGGAYICQAAGHEGMEFTDWLNENGITAILLKYRLPNGHHFIPLKDAQQAIRIVRSNANNWHINPNKIGISGFSAGGHLASTAGTHFDFGNNISQNPIEQMSCRPDFMILFYPVISMQDSLTHEGSKTCLLGNNPSKELTDLYSNELQITKDTPPTLLMLSDDDKVVIPQNSVDFYQALKNNDIPAAMYIFPEGGHGWGYKESFRYHDAFRLLMIEWMMQQKIIE